MGKMDKNELRKQIEEAHESLTKREAIVLKMRFGLDDGNEHTLEEVGRQFKIKAERTRQIEARALRKLKTNKPPKSVWDLNDLNRLSTRAASCLTSKCLDDLGDLKKINPTLEELLQINNCGEKTAREIVTLIKTL